MARNTERLTALKIGRKMAPGYHADGGGLFLQVTGSGAKSWILRYQFRKRAREMGLGPLALVGLADARAKAEKCRRLCREEIDPIDARRAERAALALAEAKTITFKQVAEEYVSHNEPEWKNAKHIAQWKSTLADYVYPVIGHLPIQGINKALVIATLKQRVEADGNLPAGPLWQARPETARRIRGRIQSIIDSAIADDRFQGENPAQMRLIKKGLGKQSTEHKHHPALPYDELPAFMAKLSEMPGTAARSLEWTILTAARTIETIGMRIPEIDQNAATWNVPAERMKRRREHRVPLSKRALRVLGEMRRDQDPEEAYIFPGRRRGRPQSNMAMSNLLERMGPYVDSKGEPITVHGFRSTFRDWVAERTNYPRELAEASLSHIVGDETERSYQRGDLFDKRRRLMDAWAAYCQGARAKGDVVSLRPAG